MRSATLVLVAALAAVAPGVAQNRLWRRRGIGFMELRPGKMWWST